MQVALGWFCTVVVAGAIYELHLIPVVGENAVVAVQPVVEGTAFIGNPTVGVIVTANPPPEDTGTGAETTTGAP